MSCPSSPSRLVLVNQTGRTDTLFSEDGTPLVYHNVAKNSLFSFVISQTTSSGMNAPLINFTNMAVQCTLVYDQNRQKCVEIISQKPMEYKLIPMLGGSQLRVEARIQVLSSQFGGSLFRIYVQVLDKERHVIPDLTLLTQPFRVRSKIKPMNPAKVSRSSLLRTSSVATPAKRPGTQLPVSIPGPSTVGMSGLPPVMKHKRVSVKQEPAESCSPVVKSEFYEDEPAAPSQMSLVLQMLSRIEKRQIHYMERVGSSSLYGSPEEVPSDYQAVPSSVMPSPFTSTCSSSSAHSGHSGEQVCYASHPVSFSDQFLHLLTMFSQMPDEQKQENLYIIQNLIDDKQRQSVIPLLNTLASPLEQSVQPSQSTSEVIPHSFGDDDESFDSWDKSYQETSD